MATTSTQKIDWKGRTSTKLDETFIRMFVKDLAMALTGDRIEFIKE